MNRQDNQPPSAISGPAKLHVRLGGETHEVDVAPHQTLLAAARDAGLEPPFTCQKGACGACLAKLVFGEVQQLCTNALEPEQIASGLILTCQSIPATEVVAVDYG